MLYSVADEAQSGKAPREDVMGPPRAGPSKLRSSPTPNNNSPKLQKRHSFKRQTLLTKSNPTSNILPWLDVGSCTSAYLLQQLEDTTSTLLEGNPRSRRRKPSVSPLVITRVI